MAKKKTAGRTTAKADVGVGAVGPRSPGRSSRSRRPRDVITVRADFFRVESDPHVEGAHRKAIDAFFADGRSEVTFTIGSDDFLVDSIQWHGVPNLMSACVYKNRRKNLPYVRNTAGGISPLNIADEEDLAEPAGFLYSPAWGIALMSYAHFGPRYRSIGSTIEKMGAKGPIIIEPIPRHDTFERLQAAPICTRFEMTLEHAGELPVTRSKAVGAGIAAAAALGGTRVTVIIDKPGSDATLEVSAVRGIVGGFIKKRERVHASKMVASVKSDVDAGTEILNILDATLITPHFDVHLDGRAIDRGHLIAMLLEQWEAHRDTLLKILNDGQAGDA